MADIALPARAPAKSRVHNKGLRDTCRESCIFMLLNIQPMRCIVLILLFTTIYRKAQSQTFARGQDGAPGMFSGFLLSVGGRIIGEERRGTVTDGTNFFMDQWMKGAAEFSNGGLCRNVPVKLNLITNEIHYQQDGYEMIATSAVRKLWLTDTATGQTFYFLHKTGVNDTAARHTVSWYQVLAEGGATLLLAHKKVVAEKTGYGAAFTDRTAKTSQAHYLLVNGRLTEIRKWKQLPAQMAGLESEAESFIDANNLKGRSAEDWIKVLEWYNQKPGK